MQLSHYLLTWPYLEKPGYYLFFSTKKASSALVPESVYFALLRGEGTASEYQETLGKLGMLVASHVQEKQDVSQYLSEINLLHPGLVVSIIPGLECNFACKYCYEGSLKGKHAMDEVTAEQLVAFIKKRFVAGRKKLTLDFYGGEPLLYTKQIKFISARLKPFVEEQGGDFRFYLVTNGSLLTRRIVEELIPFGLKGAKITLDGPADTHNVVRPFKSGKDSFDVILNNIKACCDIIYIGGSGNFTRENFREFPRLFEELFENGLTPVMIRQFNFSPAIQVNDMYSNGDFAGGCVTSNEPWVAEAVIALREETMRRGYQTAKIGPSPCMVDVNHGFVVHYDGTIYKCVGLVGHRDFVIGHVKGGIMDYRRTYQLDNWQRREECRECKYLPLCFGGCRFMEYQRTGDMSRVDCQKEYLEATLEKMLIQDVRYRYKST